MPEGTEPWSHLPLSIPVYQILLSLSDGDRHGYSIIREIRERTAGEVDLTASTLYGALSRTLKDETITEIVDEAHVTSDKRRRTYRLTDLGRDVVRAEAGRLSRALGHAVARGLGPETPTPSGDGLR